MAYAYRCRTAARLNRNPVFNSYIIRDTRCVNLWPGINMYNVLIFKQCLV